MQDYSDKKIRLLIAGECHAKRIFESLDFLKDLSSHFEIIDISYGDGRVENYLDILDIFNFFENDIFVLGGTSHDMNVNDIQYKNKIEKLIKKIFTKYKNAKIIFWNAPVGKEDRAYDKNQMFSRIKEEMANNINIFTKTIYLAPEYFQSTSHYNSQGKIFFLNELKDFILKNKEALYKPKYEVLTPSQEMYFTKNESVVFILDYKKQVPAEINAEYHDGLSSNFNHHSGKNVIPERKNIFKLKNLKHISFSDNIVNLKCQIQYY